MNYQAVRWISCGALLAVIWGSLSCASGSNSGSNKVAPTITFSTNTASISSGQSVTLNWQAFNATSVTITTSDGRTLLSSSQTSGTAQDSPTQTTTYTAVASGPGGASPPQTATVQVAINAPPQITQFTASPAELSAGQTTTLTWATTNATSITITPTLPIGDDSGPLPTSGSATVPVSATTTYSITATGPAGNAGPQTSTVVVPFILSLTASPGTIAPGQPPSSLGKSQGAPLPHSRSLMRRAIPYVIRARPSKAPRPLLRPQPPPTPQLPPPATVLPLRNRPPLR